jgi:hypothetical protein
VAVAPASVYVEFRLTVAIASPFKVIIGAVESLSLLLLSLLQATINKAKNR